MTVSLPEFYPEIKRLEFASGAPALKLDAGGVTLHYTADAKLDRVVESLSDSGLRYHLAIDRNGDICQLAPLTICVDHAGRAAWNGKSPNRHHVAIALVSWGKLIKHEAWTGEKILPSERSWRNDSFWHAATAEQLASLEKICLWLVSKGIEPKDFCGHDECCLPLGRKVDPGGVLPFTMDQLRSRLSLAKKAQTPAPPRAP